MAQIPKLIMSLSLLIILKGVFSTTFTFVNKCDYTVWPGILGSPSLGSTGFELAKGTSQSFQAPTGWSGRFWGRTGCNFDASGHGSCTTADCGSGQVECNGAGATPPATLAEFTLGSGSQDFYDVSLVDGYNIQMMVEVSGGSGPCESTGCFEDLNMRCPAELKVEGGSACNSACTAFATPEYCCKGEFNSPTACSPSVYSQIFKSACPRSYSYAYDDKTSTFTCTGADYSMTFCPNRPSSKTTRDAPDTSEGSGSGSGSEPESTTLPDGWLANLATGESSRSYSSFGAAQIVGFVIAAISVTFTLTQFF